MPAQGGAPGRHRRASARLWPVQGEVTTAPPCGKWKARQLNRPDSLLDEEFTSWGCKSPVLVRPREEKPPWGKKMDFLPLGHRWHNAPRLGFLLWRGEIILCRRTIFGNECLSPCIFPLPPGPAGATAGFSVFSLESFSR